MSRGGTEREARCTMHLIPWPYPSAVECWNRSCFAHCAFALPLHHLQSGRDAFGGGDPGGEGRVGEEAGVQGAGVAAEEEARCRCS